MSKSLEETRNEELIDQAIWSLTEYYTCLHDDVCAREIAATVKVVNTGNDQDDYVRVKGEVERLAKQHERNYSVEA